MKKTQRLDLLLVQKGLAPSRQRARALIMAGSVWVDRQPADKPGTPVSLEAEVDVKDDGLVYASRGGLKLEAALSHFSVDPAGRTCMDVGASSGGFTDCLLRHGARRVYAVDVGYGQLAWKLRQDARVIVIERTNIRHMPADRVPEPVDLITIDVSFISLRLAAPAACRFLGPDGAVIALVKPQFEVGKGKVGKGGVVRDPAQHREVLEELAAFFTEQGFSCSAPLPSPILGPKGNQEFLVRLSRGQS
jgi:23S rRNA (cytidine1920-2'-O)/16S rRNA (cytidine1409-2'-O)-methyltransferase